MNELAHLPAMATLYDKALRIEALVRAARQLAWNVDVLHDSGCPPINVILEMANAELDTLAADLSEAERLQRRERS